MKQQLEAIRAGALEAIAATTRSSDLEALRVKYLGKKGELTAVLKQMGKLSPEERPVMGQLANDVRAALERAIEAQSAVLAEKALERKLEEAQLLLFAVVRNTAVLPLGVKLGKTEKEISEKTFETIVEIKKTVDYAKTRKCMELADRRDEDAEPDDE